MFLVVKFIDEMKKEQGQKGCYFRASWVVCFNNLS